MKSHYLFDTPQGKRQQKAMHAPLYKLNRRTDPLQTADVWRNFRQERFIEPSLEGLTGPAATYHLRDAAGYVVQAAQLLAGTSHAQGVNVRDLPMTALNTLATGFGYRYERGVKGLHDALVKAGAPAQSIAQFDAKRAEFSDRIQAHLAAAFIVNQEGECPAAVVKAIRMFAGEMVTLSNWLEQIEDCGSADLIVTQMHKASDVLDAYGTQAQPKKLKKSHDI